MTTEFLTAEPFLAGLFFGECPRWHEGRLWYSDFFDRGVYSASPQGERRRELAFEGETGGLGWLPDGRLLFVSRLDRVVLRREDDGSLVQHGDLRRRMRPLALRIGIGIGEIQGRVRAPVNRLVGEAFTNARAAIADVKEGSQGYPTLTACRSSKESFDRIANLVYGLNDTLVLDMTEAQWRALNAYVEGDSVERAAQTLRVSVSTLSRNLKRSHFRQLAETAATMEIFFGDSWV